MRQIQNRVSEFEALFRIISEYAQVGYANYNLYNKEGYAQNVWLRNYGEADSAQIGDVIGKYRHIHPEDRKILLDLLARFSAGEVQSATAICRVLHDDGRKTWIKTHLICRDYRPGEQIIDMLGINYDITALKQTEQELIAAKERAEESNKLKSAFLANMSHEIRTPLNAILGFTRLALQPEKQSRSTEYLQKISYSSELLLGIVNDVLDMSAIENQKLKLDNSPFKLSQVLRELQSLYSIQCREKNISFILNSEAFKHDILLGDSLRLQQILSNLLSNAVKFTATGGQITLDITQQQADSADQTVLTMVVTDTGCGMSEQMLAQVFQPFEQEDGSTARKYGGSGLGLSIVKYLVELMGGSISVNSAKGKGSTFTVQLTLPYAEELAEKDGTTAEQNLHGLHLLLAEDNPLNQELCLELLKSRGISSDCAVNGKEALELFTNSAPGTYALILMDIQMPVLDGYQTTQAIRSSTHPQAQTIPIISLSADAFTEDIRRAYASGMNDHVSKPIVPEELFAAITRVLKTLN